MLYPISSSSSHYHHESNYPVAEMPANQLLLETVPFCKVVRDAKLCGSAMLDVAVCASVLIHMCG